MMACNVDDTVTSDVRTADDSTMADEDWYKPHRPPAPPRQPNAGELLFEFVRYSDRAPMACELRFHGESYGWEVQFLERGELFASRGAFPTREQAVQWAKTELYVIEGEPCAHCGGAGWMCEAHPDQLADHIRRATDRPSRAHAVSRRRRTNVRACRAVGTPSLRINRRDWGASLA
jgi:hypothetical protein